MILKRVSFLSSVFTVVVMIGLTRGRPTADCQLNFHAANLTDCSDVLAHGIDSFRPQSGKYRLTVGKEKRAVWAYCDMENNGGGWTVIQKRTGPGVEFYRTWSEYEQGFGDPAGDYWLGNAYIRALTTNKRYVLRIEVTDWAGTSYYAEYSNFVVDGCRYKLVSLGEFWGDFGDSFTAHVGMKFSAYDHDYDVATINCAVAYRGGWWYAGCHGANLNGQYFVGGNHSSYANGINWKTGKGYFYSYKTSVMMIRPYDF